MAMTIADRIFTNAKVYSVALDGTETRAEAVGIKDGIIIFIGSDEDAKDTPEPAAGILRREPDGTPDGYIQEPVLYGPLLAKMPGYLFDERQTRDSIRQAFALFASKGYTLMSDCQQQPLGYQVLKEMAEQGEFKARVFGCHNINDDTREADLQRAASSAMVPWMPPCMTALRW